MIQSNDIRFDRFIPLTRSQLSIWKGQQLHRQDPMYNMIFTFEFRGAIDATRFMGAFDLLVQRHDILRSSLAKDGQPLQEFAQNINNKTEFLDFSNTDFSRAHLISWINKNRTRIFHVGEVQFHSALIKLEESNYVWYFNNHHLITDGHTMQLLYEELNVLYAELQRYGIRHQVDESRFEDHARHHYAQIENDSNSFLSKNVDFEQPLLYGKKAEQTRSESTRIELNLGKDRTKLLNNLAEADGIKGWNHQMTIYHIMLTVIQVFVHKISGSTQFAIGVATHNRSKLSDKQVAGLFMELLPFKCVLDPENSFQDVYSLVCSESFSLLKEAQDLAPSDKVLRTINTVFNFVPIKFSDFNDIPTQVTWIHSGHHDPGHHIRIQMHDLNATGAYTLHFDLNDEVISPEHQQWISDHFVNVLDAFIENKETPIQRVSIISTAEIELLNSWNNTDVSYPPDETLLTGFEIQVRKTPDLPAIIFEDHAMTYLQLHKAINRMSNFLIANGLQRGEVVAVSMERSMDMIISIYAILRAGGIYMPLDPLIPNNRLHFIIKDSELIMILSNHSNITNDLFEHVKVISKESFLSEITNYPETSPLVELVPEDVAYIIYTSGSTGQPKGVKCTHKGICNRLNWMKDEIELSPSDALLQKTPITFDVSLPELFWPLQTGARLVIEQPGGHLDASHLIKTIKKYKITGIHFVPSMLNIFLEDRSVKECSTLKWVFCSGEALATSDVLKLNSMLNCEIYNMYGPTETCVEVTKWKFRDGEKLKLIPIGKTVPNTKLYILDDQLQPVPIGTPGELYISGVQVAKGYLNRDELNEQVFLTDPFQYNEHIKMYKSGDLVRHNGNGNIEFLGRIDHQVKLRGFRIELGEIETKLNEYPDIDKSVVMLKSINDANQPHLVAYCKGQDIDFANVKSYLTKFLPEYMIPMHYQLVDEFKLTSSGKVDRSALPEINPVVCNTEVIQPANEIEELLVTIWRDVMKLDQVSVLDNFIPLGGDSLVAMLLTTRINKELGLDLPVNLIFSRSNIRSYANYLENHLKKLLDQYQYEATNI